jgi:hypothetical protein
MNEPGAGDGLGEHHANCGRLDHRAECFIVVDAGSLGEAVKDPTSLVPFQGSIGVELVLEDLFIGDDVGANKARDKIPGVVGDQGSKFFFHGVVPLQIDEGSADRGEHQQQGRCQSGRQGKFVDR